MDNLWMRWLVVERQWNPFRRLGRNMSETLMKPSRQPLPQPMQMPVT
jgi:hypothetical protein